MNEDFLAFVWQYQYVKPAQLITTEGDLLRVIKTGMRNTNSGPDFTGSRLLIGNIEWVGCVEIHFRSSDWLLHQHQQDNAYESVILHVVWEDDVPVKHKNGVPVATLVLQDKIHQEILDKYEDLIRQPVPVPCGNRFRTSPEIYKTNMRERLLLERLERKSEDVLLQLKKNNNNWEETTYQLLLRYYGGKVNADAFFRLATLLPWRMLRKHRGARLQTEALLFGSAGLLPDTTDDEYVQELRKEYAFLSRKYSLTDKQMGMHEWKFLRIRPAGFPTVRLAQLAAFLYQQSGLFSFFRNTQEIDLLRNQLRTEQSDYWKHHFIVGEKSKNMIPPMGRDAADLLIINVVIPLLAGYSRYMGREPLVPEKAWSWLELIPAEKNQISRMWQGLDVKVMNAFDSQAMLEWYTCYCQKKKCLDCSVGNYILKNTS